MRIGIWIPCEGRHVARSAAKELRDSFEEVHVIRLRDRTGPSVAESSARHEEQVGHLLESVEALEKRLATAEERVILMGARMAQFEGYPAEGGTGILERLARIEEHARRFDLNRHHARLAAVQDAIAHLEAEHAALVVRVGDLEMLPAPVRPEPGSVAEDPTPEQIEAYLRGSAEWSRRDDGLSGPSSYYWHGGARGVWLGGSDCFAVIAKHEGVTTAEMRARILAAGSATAEDPDRLAKVEPTDADLLALYVPVFQAACERDQHPRAHANGLRALYNLGREHGNRERDALLADAARAIEIAGLSIGENPSEMGESEIEQVVWDLKRDSNALLARAEKAEAEVRSRDAELDAAEKLLPAEFRCEPALLGVDGIPHLIADWQKRGEELEALRAAMPRRTAEEERADVVAFWETRIKQHPRGSSEYRAMRATLDQFEFGEHVGAAARSATRPGAPTPTAPDATRDPLTDLPADLRTMHEKACAHYMAAEHKSEFDRGIAEGIRIVEIHVAAFQRDATRPTATPSEAEMAAELRREGWQYLPVTDRWYPPRVKYGDRSVPITDAHAAMRAAKGAK